MSTSHQHTATPGTASPLPRLRVRTQRLDEHVDLLARIPADVTAVWLRHGHGLIAVGCAERIVTAGESRFADASSRFRALAGAADVEDEAQVRGSGLVALGSFSYSAGSPRPSTLVIPEAVLGRSGDVTFLTTVTRDGSAAASTDWRELFGPTPPDASVAATVTPDHTPAAYQRLVAETIARITAGAADKVVLSERSTVTSDDRIEPAVLLRRLAERFPSTWVYKVSDVLGASPEMLAQTDHGRLFSRVLAGSRVAEGGRLSEDERRAFRADPKERSEHAFAIDSVTSRLGSVAEDVTASAEPFILRLPGIEHLASDVSAALRPGVTSLDVAAVLHPSAAVSGTPRDAADAIIAELEPHDRGGYAGPVGWMDARGDGQWAIALRLAHLRGPHEVALQAGGGIVAASDPVVEHAEALAKTRPLLRALFGADGSAR
ncbi:isochorismate synthase [Nigerium massiliense]|uniref:isochorismate synthase n=1 Tax=Nigerium massiliense TaxID=1522317 RepID=UPI00058F4C8E|nr:chorismate-binding protein [Nigerium massiliense]